MPQKLQTVKKVFAIRHTYSGVSVVDEVFQMEKGGIRARFEVLQEEGWLQLLTPLSLQTVREVFTATSWSWSRAHLGYCSTTSMMLHLEQWVDGDGLSLTWRTSSLTQ